MVGTPLTLIKVHCTAYHFHGVFFNGFSLLIALETEFFSFDTFSFVIYLPQKFMPIKRPHSYVLGKKIKQGPSPNSHLGCKIINISPQCNSVLLHHRWWKNHRTLNAGATIKTAEHKTSNWNHFLTKTQLVEEKL